MQAIFTFLGTGPSAGIPLIGCSCDVCRSSDPHNQRLRPAGVIHVGDKVLLIDIGPDFRQQALKFGLSHLDGVLITHAHFDHIAGIDELRALNFQQKKSFPCLMSKETLREIESRFPYLFQSNEEKKSKSAQLDCQALPKEAGETDFLGVKIRYMSYRQAGMKVTGYRIGNFAYVSDIREYDDSIFDELKGVKKLVLSALREEPSPVHFSLTEAVAFARKVGAEKTWLTHMSHSVEHNWACRHLPPDVQPGYDGLTIPFQMNPHA
ncbi:MAG: MBL fold metallo-hydrolase [Verrucomicrobiota bacterium]|nr:MBL fold metallo-hydrolase [Verrucomicrobiota bacterium]